MNSEQARSIISCRGVWKVFGPSPERVTRAAADGSRADRATGDDALAMGHVVAVRDVSFDVQPGETFVVMGLSGSGKSTLLRCLPRLIEPTQGEILVDGVNIATTDQRTLRDIRRHKMSMVFQNFGLFPHRRILDNVAYGLEIQGMKKTQRYAKARAVLELVNLAGWEQYYPGQLSGGMQQRVGLARALAVDPEILLFDEPFSALDPLIRWEMQDELIRLQQQMHKTIVFITHDFAEAIKLGDRIAIMKDGEFVQVDTAESMVLHPANNYVAEFTKDVPRAKALTARAIMRPAAEFGTMTTGERQPVLVTVRLEELIPLLAESDVSLPVVDEQDTLVGCVDRTAIMLALDTNDLVAKDSVSQDRDADNPATDAPVTVRGTNP